VESGRKFEVRAILGAQQQFGAKNLIECFDPSFTLTTLFIARKDSIFRGASFTSSSNVINVKGRVASSQSLFTEASYAIVTLPVRVPQ